MRLLIRYDLDYEKTLPFFLSNTSSSHIVSSIVTKNIDFKSGCFFTLLPSEADKNQIYAFPLGGILPQTNKENPTGYLNYVPTPNIDIEMCRLVSLFVHKNSHNFALLENYVASPSDKHVLIPGVKAAFYQEEVYYLINKNSSEAGTFEAFRKAGKCWHSLIILSCCDTNIFNEFSNDNIITTVNNVRYIITTAYDGEGYIIWEKRREINSMA